ncbi:MAG TPA: two-component regulator propeller domain-containing protein [Pelomicrobium sp.]|nr:two-component regulator propeller domain-containing protein [Pelomicrobium sp.]
MRRKLVGALAAAALAMAAPAPAGAAEASLAVKDSYEVGANVYVRALTVEPARGVIWVGTSAGVHEVELKSGRLLSTFTRNEGLANEYVFAIGIDQQGYKWFGTNAGGVSRYRDGNWKTFFPMHGLADYWIYSFARQGAQAFWIGTWAGVNRYDLQSGRFTTYVKELVNEWVYGIAVDARERVWFGTEGGVSMFDGKSWTSWTHKEGLGADNAENLPLSPNTGLGTRSRHDLNVGAEGRATYNPNYVFCIHAASDGAIWAGTWGGGVSRFDGKAWSNLTERDGLAGNIVYSIAQESGGALWFGTNKGLSRYDGKTWRNFGRREGLLEEHVYAIAIAPGGDVWIGTKKGVARIAR